MLRIERVGSTVGASCDGGDPRRDPQAGPPGPLCRTSSLVASRIMSAASFAAKASIGWGVSGSGGPKAFYPRIAPSVSRSSTAPTRMLTSPATCWMRRWRISSRRAASAKGRAMRVLTSSIPRIDPVPNVRI